MTRAGSPCHVVSRGTGILPVHILRSKKGGGHSNNEKSVKSKSGLDNYVLAVLFETVRPRTFERKMTNHNYQ